MGSDCSNRFISCRRTWREVKLRSLAASHCRYRRSRTSCYLAKNSGIDPEIALLGCHADRNENPQIKGVWESIAKKFNGLGLSGISTVCAVFVSTEASPAGSTIRCVLCMLC